MWIQSDEYDDWFGTAQEYIDNYKDEIFEWQKNKGGAEMHHLFAFLWRYLPKSKQ